MKNKSYPYYETESINDLKELIYLSAEKYSDKPAFTFERKKEVKSISYNQFKSDMFALGTALFDLRLRGANIAVIGENSYEWILTYFAVVNSGNIIVPLDKELTASDIQNLLNDSGAEAIVYSDSYSDIIGNIKESDSKINQFINMESISELIKKGDSLIKQGEKAVVDYTIDNKAIAAIIYTSGTTGISKGVMLSHFNFACNTVAACQHVGIFGSNMLVLPIHHTFGFTAGVCAMLLKGSEIFINSSLKNVLSDLGKFKPCNMFLVPLFVETFYKKIWSGAKEKGKEELLKKLIKISKALLKIGIDVRRVLFKSVLKAFGGNLKLIVSGGAPIDEKYIDGLRCFGINVLNGYGITECSPIVAVNRNSHYKSGSVGQVLPCCEVKISEPNENGHGEILVKGDIVMLGYYKNEQATEDAFYGEWFKTGDIGYLDKNNFLFISGRKKNLIILNNGKNIYPEELEFVLLDYIPYIKEVVVYADDNVIVAELFLDIEIEPNYAERLDNDIVELNRKLAVYMNIGKVVIRDTEFPKTTTKKIKRQYNDGGSTNA
ncbi:MAG: AMP-binding protein [Defluviitaleaceae bacterium]|nr:AMP-binding protein [Defluviitaleaceae bacterium]